LEVIVNPILEQAEGVCQVNLGGEGRKRTGGLEERFDRALHDDATTAKLRPEGVSEGNIENVAGNEHGATVGLGEHRFDEVIVMNWRLFLRLSHRCG
jgi:hypothetical protein